MHPCSEKDGLIKTKCFNKIKISTVMQFQKEHLIYLSMFLIVKAF